MEPQTHTVNFYKLQAKKLKRELGIQHAEALDRTAIKYGFSNWKHCLKANSIISHSETKSNNLTFTDWLNKQKNRDTPLGDLARDMANDNTWPSHDRFEDYENYLYSKRASWQAIDTLKKA